jgi:hypothetical protein
MSEIKTRQCPACHGEGGRVEPVLDFGEGPFEPCGFCNGRGIIMGNYYFTILGWLSAIKRDNIRLDAEMLKLAEEAVRQKQNQKQLTDSEIKECAQRLVDDVIDVDD